MRVGVLADGHRRQVIDLRVLLQLLHLRIQPLQRELVLQLLLEGKPCPCPCPPVSRESRPLFVAHSVVFIFFLTLLSLLNRRLTIMLAMSMMVRSHYHEHHWQLREQRRPSRAGIRTEEAVIFCSKLSLFYVLNRPVDHVYEIEIFRLLPIRCLFEKHIVPITMFFSESPVFSYKSF